MPSSINFVIDPEIAINLTITLAHKASDKFANPKLNAEYCII